METVASIILNNAQTNYDGGVIASILQNVRLLGNPNIKNEVMPYLTSPRLTGGYVAGLIFGIIWLFILLLVMIYKCAYNCRSYKDGKLKKPVPSGIEKNRRLYSSNKFMNLFLLIFLVIMLVFALILLILYIVNISQLQQSIKSSARGYAVNSSAPNALLPGAKNSFFHIKQYARNFASDARKRTSPIVEDIIAHTLKMQKETQKHFNAILMEAIYVTPTFKISGKMTDIIVKFFELSESLQANKEKHKRILDILFPSDSDPNFSFTIILRSIRSLLNNQSVCNESCKMYKEFFNQRFSKESKFPTTDFASSFLFLMKKSKKTRESVLAQAADGKLKMAKMKEKTAAKMRARLNIPELIRNASFKNWDLMDQKMPEVIERINKIEGKYIESDTIETKMSKYSTMIAMLFTLPLVLIICVIICIFVSIIRRSYIKNLKIDDERKNCILNSIIYGSFGLVAFVLLITMVLFLYGGKVETELCRYIRTDQPVFNSDNSSHLALDTTINKVLYPTLKELTKNMTLKMPLPKPENILYGLLYRCRNNEPIAVAFDIIKSIDMAALSDPEMSNLIVKVGREIMNESLKETDPDKMIPPDTKKTLQQASQLDMFIKVNITQELEKVPITPILVRQPDGNNVPLSINLLKDRLDKILTTYKANPDLENNIKKFNELLNDFLDMAENTTNIFLDLKNVPLIEPVVNEMSKSLTKMVDLMRNKTELLEIANYHYDRLIASTTPQKSAETMALFGPKILGELGRCKSIYLAYSSTVDTICNVVVSKFNASWVYLGTLVLILTMLLLPIINNYFIGHYLSTNDKTFISPSGDDLSTGGGVTSGLSVDEIQKMKLNTNTNDNNSDTIEKIGLETIDNKSQSNNKDNNEKLSNTTTDELKVDNYENNHSV